MSLIPDTGWTAGPVRPRRPMPLPGPAMPLPVVFGLAAVLLHAAIAAFTPYGIFRDELYYIACSKRLALGYVDHPPLSIAVLAGLRALIGESLFAIRLLPALLSGVTVGLTAVLALRMGGTRFSAVLAALAAMFAPIALAMSSVYSMNAIDHLFWTLGAYALLRLLQGARAGESEDNAWIDAEGTRWWLLLGLLIGAGAMNKIGMLWFAAGLVVATLLPPLRRWLRTPWPWLAALLAALLFLPYVLWNAAHDWAHLEFIRNASTMKYGGITPLSFFSDLLLEMHPLYLPVWLCGWWYLLFHREGRRWRPLAAIPLVTLAILLVNGHSKAEYFAPTFPLLFAAGAAWIGQALRNGTVRHAAAWRAVSGIAVVAAGLLLLPLATPVLPVPLFQRYTAFIGVSHPNSESRELAELPQFFADMHGWEELARTVSEVYLSLPEQERRDAVVFARNYGQAGAIEYFRKRYPSPRVICVHNNYWLWGYPEHMGTVIVIGGDERTHRASCRVARKAAVFRSPHVMPYENNTPIWICRGLHRAIREIWKEEKAYI